MIGMLPVPRHRLSSLFLEGLLFTGAIDGYVGSLCVFIMFAYIDISFYL